MPVKTLSLKIIRRKFTIQVRKKSREELFAVIVLPVRTAYQQLLHPGSSLWVLDTECCNPAPIFSWSHLFSPVSKQPYSCFQNVVFWTAENDCTKNYSTRLLQNYTSVLVPTTLYVNVVQDICCWACCQVHRTQCETKVVKDGYGAITILFYGSCTILFLHDQWEQ